MRREWTVFEYQGELSVSGLVLNDGESVQVRETQPGDVVLSNYEAEMLKRFASDICKNTTDDSVWHRNAKAALTVLQKAKGE